MNKLQIRYSNRYKTSRKNLNEKDKELLENVVQKLASAQSLDKKYKDHSLIGKYKDFRECHIKPNLFLIYRINNKILELFLADVGSHSDIFG